MNKEVEIIKYIPLTLYKLLRGKNCYLVGGAARYACGTTTKKPDDYDILYPKKPTNRPGDPLPFNIEYENLLIDLHDMCSFSAHTYLHGNRFFIEDWQLDIWPGRVDKYLSEVPVSTDGIAISVDTGCVLMTADFASGLAYEITTRKTTKSKSYQKHLQSSLTSIGKINVNS